MNICEDSIEQYTMFVWCKSEQAGAIVCTDKFLHASGVNIELLQSICTYTKLLYFMVYNMYLLSDTVFNIP